MMSHIAIDGAEGEGGGQLLRSALALSLATSRPFVMHGIRGKRERPGLQRQHLAGLRLAAEIGAAEVLGDALGSTEVEFAPRALRTGQHMCRIGTAGSVTLVAQAVLPPLLLAQAPSRLVLEGGTHVPSAPPFEFLAETLAPVLEQMGARVTTRLERHGFHPAGGGRIEIEVTPTPRLAALSRMERVVDPALEAHVLVVQLPMSIAQREMHALGSSLGLAEAARTLVGLDDGAGPGNALTLRVRSSASTTVLSAVGRRGVPADRVAHEVAEQAKRLIGAEVPVDEHLADQLLVPLSLGAGGEFLTTEPSSHTRSVAALIPKFVDMRIDLTPMDGPRWRIGVTPNAHAKEASE